MWYNPIGLIIFFKIASVLTSENGKITDPSTSSDNWIVQKEYKLILIKATWYTANELCMKHEMHLAVANTPEEQQQLLNKLLEDKYNNYQDFWISSAIFAREGAFKLTGSKDLFSLSNWNPRNQCSLLYWMNLEFCVVLWPLENEWNYDRCDEKKYFICERITSREESILIKENSSETAKRLAERDLLNAIEEELAKLIDEMMFLHIAEAIATIPEDQWINFVTEVFYKWLEQQQQKQKSFLSEEVVRVAGEVDRMSEMLENDDLHNLVIERFKTLQHEGRLPLLLRERFGKMIGDEYIQLEEDAKLASVEMQLDEMVSLLVQKMTMLAKEEQNKQDKLKEEPLGEELMKEISQELIKLNEAEYMTYVLEIMNKSAQLGMQDVNMDIIFQLFLLVKQELFTLLAKSAVKDTLEERRNIAGYALSKILEGDLEPTENKSAFGEVFVLLVNGMIELTEDERIQLEEEHLRIFVRKEFDKLKNEDLMNLKYDAYIKFMIDEFIELALESSLVTNESGHISLENIRILLASKLFWFVDDEMKSMAERLSKFRVDAPNYHVSMMMAQFTDWQEYNYEVNKLLKLVLLVEQELFTTTKKLLSKLTEAEIMEFVERGFSKLLSADTYKLIAQTSGFGKVLISLAEELSELTGDEYANLTDDELKKIVKLELQIVKQDESMELLAEVSVKLIADEFINLIEEGASTLTPDEEGKHYFGETVNILTAKLLKMAEKDSAFLS